MSETVRLIQEMKRDSYEGALARSIPVIAADNTRIGRLVPVGTWILRDREKVMNICAWRQEAMRMFFIQFESTYERTLAYLENYSIAERNRIFFLILDDEDRFVGHIGMSNIDNDRGELDNVMRGLEGGPPGLMYFSAVALLNWSFKTLGIEESCLRNISYNSMAESLYEAVGYVLSGQIPLRKRVQDGTVFHDAVSSPSEANVSYRCSRMRLTRGAFYAKAHWL